MTDAALLMWIVTTLGGLLLLGIWLGHGGGRRPADDPPEAREAAGQTAVATKTRSRFALSSLVSHAALAAIGLMVWAIFNANSGDPDYGPAPWFSVILLLVTGALGFTMFVPWLADRRAPGRSADGDGAPEQHLPSALVIGHGLAAAATLVLVLLVALD